jgi:hypothetical protein
MNALVKYIFFYIAKCFFHLIKAFVYHIPKTGFLYLIKNQPCVELSKGIERGWIINTIGNNKVGMPLSKNIFFHLTKIIFSRPFFSTDRQKLANPRSNTSRWCYT